VHVAIPVPSEFAGMKILCHVYFVTKKRQLLFAMLTFRSSLKKIENNPETRKSRAKMNLYGRVNAQLHPGALS
jgi:hypothetical protein